MESRMHPKLHVRFGGRAGETHQLKSRKGAPVRPYTYVPTWSGFAWLEVLRHRASCVPPTPPL